MREGLPNAPCSHYHPPGMTTSRQVQAAWACLALPLLLLPGGCPRKAAEGDDDHKPAVDVHCVVAQRGSVEERIVLRGRIAPPPGGDLPIASQIAKRAA